MTRLFLSASLAIAINATIAGCAAQSGGTVDYSTALQDAGTFATIVNGVVGVFAATHTAPIAAVEATAPQVTTPPLGASAPQ